MTVETEYEIAATNAMSTQDTMTNELIDSLRLKPRFRPAEVRLLIRNHLS